MGHSKIRVLLFGPKLTDSRASYGGGAGGIVTAMRQLLKHFQTSNKLEIVYVAYGARDSSFYWPLLLPFRLIKDMSIFCTWLGSVDIVHIAANAGPAIVRTLFAVLIGKLCAKKVLTDVRGSSLDFFVTKKMNIFSRILWLLILEFSDFYANGYTLFSKAKVSLLYKEHKEGVKDHSFMLWKLLNFFIWTNRYKVVIPC